MAAVKRVESVIHSLDESLKRSWGDIYVLRDDFSWKDYVDVVCVVGGFLVRVLECLKPCSDSEVVQKRCVVFVRVLRGVMSSFYEDSRRGKGF